MKVKNIGKLKALNALIKMMLKFDKLRHLLESVYTIKNGLIDDKRYSSWQSIVRVMGWLERFGGKERQQTVKKGKNDAR